MPAVRGLPPVTWAVRPGNESEGMGVCASVYAAPPPTSFASSELGWWDTYHLTSDWCRPSTEISSTCATLPARALRCSLPESPLEVAKTVVAGATVAHIAAAIAASAYLPLRPCTVHLLRQ